MKLFPRYHQFETMDCGPTCLRMIAKYYGGNYSLLFLRERIYIYISIERNKVNQGQQQRTLIARTVYKNLVYIFLDEATNALDTKN